MGQLTYPLDGQDKAIIEQVVSEALRDKILDTIWDDYFYYSSFLEGWAFPGVYNWDLSSDPATDKGIQYSFKGVGLLDSGIMQISAGPTAGNGTQISKSPLNQPILTFDRVQRFRTQIKLTTVGKVITSIRIGDVGTTKNHYGFSIDEATLYGTCGNGTATNGSVTLKTGLTADADLLIEARLIPGEKITFYASTSGISDLKEVGVLTTPLPKGDIFDDSFSTWIIVESLAKTGVSDEGDWITATGYSVDDIVFIPGVNAYFRCIHAHTSDASTEPPSGGSWQDEWEYFGVQASFIEYIQKKPLRGGRKIT